MANYNALDVPLISLVLIHNAKVIVGAAKRLWEET